MVKADIRDRLLKELSNYCRLHGLSPKTFETYSSVVNAYLDFITDNKSKLSHDSVKNYLLSLDLSANSVRLHRAALATFFAHVIGMPFSQYEIPLQKKNYSLPNVLTKKQVKDMIEQTENLKHQLIIKLLYSCGLRLSELQNLKREDIDFEKGMLQVKHGKGNKDRYTIISESLKEDFLQYYATHNFTTPYVLQGRKNKYSKKSIQKVIKQAAIRIGVNASPHTLRHSFATPLMESGVSLRHIQTLLGHASIKTTQVYTHVANNDLANISNPLDEL